MFFHKATESSDNVIDQAAQSAEHAIRSTQRIANEKLDRMAGNVKDIQHQTSPMLERASDRASAMMQRGADGMRDVSHHVQQRALRVSDNTVGYIRDEPVKSVLIAAATGAALVALVGLLSRSRARS